MNFYLCTMKQALLVFHPTLFMKVYAVKTAYYQYALSGKSAKFQLPCNSLAVVQFGFSFLCI